MEELIIISIKVSGIACFLLGIFLFSTGVYKKDDMRLTIGIFAIFNSFALMGMGYVVHAACLVISNGI